MISALGALELRVREVSAVTKQILSNPRGGGRGEWSGGRGVEWGKGRGLWTTMLAAAPSKNHLQRI